MPTPQAYVTSFSTTKSLMRRLRDALPRYGDRSRLIHRLLEMWLSGEILVYNVNLRPRGQKCPTQVSKSQ